MHHNHSEMGGTSGKGFTFPLSRGDLEDGVEDQDVREKNQQEGAKHNHNTKNKNDYLNAIIFCASCLNDGTHVTEEVINFLLSTERQCEYKVSIYQGQGKASHRCKGH